MKNKINLLFSLFAVLFILTLPFHPYSWSFLPKAIPALIAASACIFLLKKRSDALPMGLGFLFCMAGDIFLDLDRELYFVQGLASFLMGHIMFLIMFIRKFNYTRAGALKAGGIVIYIIVISFVLIPHLGTLFIPVTAYMLVIGAMGISAAFVKTCKPYIFIGSSIFILSDSIIAITKFLWTFDHRIYFIISLYFTALFFIQYGVIKEFGRT